MENTEFNEFNELYKKYHQNDNSLICLNGVLYYNGETTYIYGFVSVVKGEQIYLGNYPIRQIDPGIWKLNSPLLFFNLRESVKFFKKDDTYLKQGIQDFLSLANKNDLSEYDKSKLSYKVDYYLSLNSIENTLRNELYDYYICFKDEIIPTIIKADHNGLTDGFKLIQEKLYNLYQSNNTNNNEKYTEGKGYARTLVGAAGKQKKEVPFTPNIYNENNSLNTSAYINAFIIIFGVLALIFFIMLFIIRK